MSLCFIVLELRTCLTSFFFFGGGGGGRDLLSADVLIVISMFCCLDVEWGLVAHLVEFLHNCG